MNCHTVQQLLSAERDQTLGAEVRGPLEAHLAGCASCRQMRATLAEAAETWRATTASARVPDERLEWPRIRRRLHGEPTGVARSTRGIFTVWRSATLGALAAAVAVGVFMAPEWFRRPPTVAVASSLTDSVEVGSDASSAMVFVDDQSGWLVVWAAGTGDKVEGQKS